MKKSINQSTLMLILNGISIAALIFMAIAFGCYSNVDRKIEVANNDRFSLTYNANRFMNGSSYLTNEVRAYAATGEQTHYDNYWNEIDNLKNRDIGVANMKEIGITSEEQAMIDEMSALSNTLVPLEESAMNDVAAGRMQQAIQYVYGPDYSSSIDKINAIKSDFLEVLDTRAQKEINRLIGVRNFIRLNFLVALILVGILQVLNLSVTKRRILIPLIKIRDEMDEISKGNLSSNFPLEPDTSEMGMLVHSIHITKKELQSYIQDISDKLSQMAQGNMDLVVDASYYQGEFVPIRNALITILDSLNQALSQIHHASDEVTAGSASVASGAQALSHGAVEQSSAAEQLNASIQEISAQVDDTAQDAISARTCSTNASSRLMMGNQKMQELSDAMKDISGSSSQIGGIIKTIEDIAFQTNILALNAAVEAARAGAAGKGFAVVADEVRNLAAKSSEAAKNTTALIENTLRMVEKGAALTEDTTAALLAVVERAEELTQIIGKITDSSTQQTEALHQLKMSIEQISSVIQINADTAEKSAEASEQLNDMANMLDKSVQRFKLRQSSVHIIE